MRFGEELMRQADTLASFSEDAPQITRTYLSAQHKQAGEYLIELMKRAGMGAGFDALGNIVGRYLADDPSGAGHDAMEFPAVAPTAMLFVRCGNNGISHHPDETMTAADAEIATSVFLHFLENYEPTR